jgi:hypothetical protein
LRGDERRLRDGDRLARPQAAVARTTAATSGTSLRASMPNSFEMFTL